MFRRTTTTDTLSDALKSVDDYMADRTKIVTIANRRTETIDDHVKAIEEDERRYNDLMDQAEALADGIKRRRKLVTDEIAARIGGAVTFPHADDDDDTQADTD